jgi:hypothetical protein
MNIQILYKIDIKYIFLSLLIMVYYISKFTIGFIFIISKFLTSTYTQIANPVLYFIQKCISFKYKSIDVINKIEEINEIDKIDIQDDYKQLNTQEICCIIIQNNTNNSDKNKLEPINNPNTDITDKNNNKDEKYLSNDRLYGWFVDIEKQNSIIT